MARKGSLPPRLTGRKQVPLRLLEQSAQRLSLRREAQPSALQWPVRHRGGEKFPQPVPSFFSVPRCHGARPSEEPPASQSPQNADGCPRTPAKLVSSSDVTSCASSPRPEPPPAEPSFDSSCHLGTETRGHWHWECNEINLLAGSGNTKT